MQDVLESLSLRHCVPEFVLKLYAILQNPQHENIISWYNDTEVNIKDCKKFQELLTKYFRHSKLCSFIRQLNMYGFSKLTKDCKKQLFFYNQNFKRGNIEDLIHIKRKNKRKDEVNDQSEKYQKFIDGNISILFEDLTRIKNGHPQITTQLDKIFQILNTIVQKGTKATIDGENKKDRKDQILDNTSVCSIEKQFNEKN